MTAGKAEKAKAKTCMYAEPGPVGGPLFSRKRGYNNIFERSGKFAMF